MVPCCPPPSSDFNFKGKSDRHMPYNSPQLSQHGDVFFNGKITFFFILLNIVMQAGNRHASEQKVSFHSYFMCFFLCRCIESMHINPRYPLIFFQQHHLFFHHVLAWCWSVRGVAMVTTQLRLGKCIISQYCIYHRVIVVQILLAKINRYL